MHHQQFQPNHRTALTTILYTYEVQTLNCVCVCRSKEGDRRGLLARRALLPCWLFAVATIGCPLIWVGTFPTYIPVHGGGAATPAGRKSRVFSCLNKRFTLLFSVHLWKLLLLVRENASACTAAIGAGRRWKITFPPSVIVCFIVVLQLQRECDE